MGCANDVVNPFGGQYHCAVDIRKNEIARLHMESQDFDGHIEIDDVDIGVGGGDKLGECGEAHRGQSRQIADGAVSDDSVAIECAQDFGVDVA